MAMATVVSALALTTKRVLVTGANKGIGRQICKRILTDHPDVHVLLGARSPTLGEAAVRKLEAEVADSVGRIEAVEIDVSDEQSVSNCAAAVGAKYGATLYGILNNAGIGPGSAISQILEVNTYGPRRVCEAFLPLLDQEVGRVVNMASASGPMYVRGLSAEMQEFFSSRETTWEQLESEMKRNVDSPDGAVDAYGLSKACLNVYTMQLAAAHPGLRINSCTPGSIQTEGFGSKDLAGESNCHVAPLFLLFGNPEGNGRYYGSDAVRSPLDRYRGPGDPPYMGD